MGFAALGVASVLMLVAFMLGLHVAATLGILSFSLMYFFSDRPLWEMLGLVAWNTNTSFVLVAIPLFILMGEILLRSGVSDRLYRVLSLWLRPLPGGLMHSNIAACAVFAAVYGVLMEVSIGKLYMAGFVPGIMLSLLFMAIIFGAALIWPNIAPREPAAPLRELLRSLVEMVPTFFLIFLVLGTIYLGVATPTDAAAFGVVGSFVLAAVARQLNLPMLKRVCISSVRTTAMVMLILTGAFILNSILALLGVPYAIPQWVASSGLSPTATMILIVVFYLVLGTFMDGFSMMVTTIPVMLPILKTQNVDLVWFGVIATILTEAALISPPEGLNLYVIHALRDRKTEEQRKRTIMDVYVGVMPFFVMMIVAIVILMVFPQIALWLPTTMKGN